ncbi:MAG: hypothetical protein CSH37_13475 [Thalassolituus sp.]|nr:MAG: hypothetical protein CSH37_13475 [Thalassolituus sp.]
MFGNTVRWVLLTLLFLSFSGVLLAGELDEFESSVESGSVSSSQEDDKEHTEKDHLSRGKKGCGIDFTCSFLSLVLDTASGFIVYGGQASFYRVGSAWGEDNDDSWLDVSAVNRSVSSHRQPGEPLVPFIRFDLDIYTPSSTVSARDLRLETGYGAVAVGYGQSRLRERNPSDSLDISQVYGLYRMSLGSHFEVDFGVGSLKVDGEKNQSYSYVTTPILLHASKNVGVEYRPSLAGNLSSHDLSVQMKIDFASVKVGYKKLSTDTRSLNGPYIGIALYY